jgi:inner membrane protein
MYTSQWLIAVSILSAGSQRERVRAGEPLAYAIAGGVVLAGAVLSWSIHTNAAGFYPFFYDWARLYGEGIVDAYEWKQNRFRFF